MPAGKNLKPVGRDRRTASLFCRRLGSRFGQLRSRIAKIIGRWKRPINWNCLIRDDCSRDRRRSRPDRRQWPEILRNGADFRASSRKIGFAAGSPAALTVPGNSRKRAFRKFQAVLYFCGAERRQVQNSRARMRRMRSRDIVNEVYGPCTSFGDLLPRTQSFS